MGTLAIRRGRWGGASLALEQHGGNQGPLST